MRFRVGESINNRHLVSVEKPGLAGVSTLTRYLSIFRAGS